MNHAPVATYRLQLHGGFGFRAAAGLLDYLERLGISDVYTSPYLAAEPGSTHGYNVVNHGALNPELGDEGDYQAWTDGLLARGMGHILDLVPNHMGIAPAHNAWWADVLENGPNARHADYFDIEWQPLRPGLENRVLLPILGDQYGNVLERGELQVSREGGQFWIHYWERRLPVAPKSLIQLLTWAADHSVLPESDAAMMELRSIISALIHLPAADTVDPDARLERAREKEVVKRRIDTLCQESEAIAAAIARTLEHYNGRPGDPASFDALDQLLRQQNFRLAFWQVATEEINYRRFFDINDLAAVRMEHPEVFEASHRLVFKLIRDGRITGLRLDHTDGLYDPLGYFASLQEPFRSSAAERLPIYVLAEKILEPGEKLPARWPIHGTTGYDYLSQVGGLWVDPKAAKTFDTLYGRFTGEGRTYEQQLHDNKRLIMHTSLSSEVNVLAHQLQRLAEGNRKSRDFTLLSLTTALIETIAAFPVYRTYVRADGSRGEHDDRHIHRAIRLAMRLNPTINASVFGYLRDMLQLRFPDNADAGQREAQTQFALKFQQVTSPVMAKGAEDTSFYTYNRLVSLNEVGADPAHFGHGPAKFHAGNQERLKHWPLSMLATSTHDTKRGEDTRARISVLSEMPDEWRRALHTWHRLAEGHKTHVDDEAAPSRNDEYLFYQVVLGAWPLDGNLEGFAERIGAYMAKAAKEAKRHTSWVNPSPEYDEALQAFVAGMLGDKGFLKRIGAFAELIAPYGAANGLAQTLLKLTSPGVPDTYQGCELWHQTLVDPDNRRPVDYPLRRRMLDEVQTRRTDRLALARDLLARYRDGAVKLYVTTTALTDRQAHADLYRHGEYLPIDGGDHVVAFARRHAGQMRVTVVPRLSYKLTGGRVTWPLGEVWGDLELRLPESGRWQNLLTGETLEGDRLALGHVLAHFPVALLARS